MDVRQITTQHLADDGGRAKGNAKQAEGLRPLFGIGEQHLYEGDGLRHHERGTHSLEEAGLDQLETRCRKATETREEGKQKHSPEEHFLTAEMVAGPAAGDEEGGIAQQVAGDDELHLAIGAVYPLFDGGDGDVDDKDVDHG